MVFNKIIIKNFKQFEFLELDLSADLNILVGDNETGKSTILEAVALVTTGRFCGKRFESFLSNDIFNHSAVERYLASLLKDKKLSPPAILIELYAVDNPTFAKKKGQNNSLNSNVPGIKYEIFFNEKNSGDTYVELLKKNAINDLPLEFYCSEWRFFSGEGVNAYNNPISASIIDTAQVNNNVLGSYIGQEIKESLTDDEIRDLGTAYRSVRGSFAKEKILEKLNTDIAGKVKFQDKTVGVALTSVTIAEWQKELSLSVDNIAFSFSGKGIQNAIKTNLALGKIQEKSTLLLIEEPENNLSYTNMSKLIDEIIASNSGKQIFIATHSSFVANKLGLDKIKLLSKTSRKSLTNLPASTINYFKKLPGYETLRFVIAGKTILVEGPTDELIVQAAYKKKYNKLPISNGIDIISVQSLAFKRFCDIAVLINKPAIIVTDNDGNISDKITKKYSDYDAEIKSGMIKIFYEKNEGLLTVEPSFVNANKANFVALRTLFGLVTSATESEVVEYMKKNKTDWALKVFDSPEQFNYPENIEECITHVGG